MGRIFPKFCELACICEICFQRKLCYVTWSVNFHMSKTQMTLYMYFKSFQCSAKSNRSSLGSYSAERFLQLFTKCQDWFNKTQDRTVAPYKHDLRSIYTSFFTMKKRFFFCRESIQVLGFHMLGKVDTLNCGGTTAMLPHPAPTSPCSFHENSYCKIEFCHWFAKYVAREIYALYGSTLWARNRYAYRLERLNCNHDFAIVKHCNTFGLLLSYHLG